MSSLETRMASGWRLETGDLLVHAAAVLIELRIPACASLKEKRRRLRPILAHLRRRMELSTAEVDHQDAWQRCSLGVAVVAPGAARLDEIMERLRGWFLAQDDVVLVDFEITHLELP